MKLYELMDYFTNLCFCEIVSGEITEHGFDFTYKGVVYNSLITDFIQRINDENLTPKEIIDYLIEPTGDKLLIHFYDNEYYNPKDSSCDVAKTTK